MAPLCSGHFGVGTPGFYEVRLFVGNGFDGTAFPAQRVFDVAIEGTVLSNLDDIDLAADFGHLKGGMISNIVQVTDGTINIDFLHDVAENPLINGIEIVKLGGGPAISIAHGPYTVSEGVAGGKLQIVLQADQIIPSNGEPVDITFQIVPGSATPKVDYDYNSPNNTFFNPETGVYTSTVTIVPSSTNVGFLVDILQDSLIEGNETFTVNIVGVSNNAQLGSTTSTTVTIQDDEVTTNSGIFWLNDITQQTLLWQMDGGTIVAMENISQLPEAGWNPHVGDLSGDGKSDIFWFNEITQQTSWWQMNGGTIVTAEYISQIPEAGWKPHVGDLSGDSKSDIFWFNEITQQTSWWQMDGGQVVTAEFISQIPEPGWNPHVGDLNGDGNDDIFWFNEITQQTSWWQMDGGQVVTAEFISQIPEPGWNPHVGDLNGDGNNDIFWFNEITQQTSWWQMDGGQVVTAEFISQIPEPGWDPHVGDLNGDGNDDIFWLNGSTQQTSWWQMNGGTIVTAEYISQLSEPGWNPQITNNVGNSFL